MFYVFFVIACYQLIVNVLQFLLENKEGLEAIYLQKPISTRRAIIAYKMYNNQEQLIRNTYDVIQRTGDSLQRSNQIAYETEQIGTEVLSELGEQRESLLRSSRRLENADDNISQSRKIIRKLQREVLYNKIILILVIIMEIAILIGLVVIKFISK